MSRIRQSIYWLPCFLSLWFYYSLESAADASRPPTGSSDVNLITVDESSSDSAIPLGPHSDFQNSFKVAGESSIDPVFARQFLQTTSTSLNMTSLNIINTSEQEQIFRGTLWNGNGTQQGNEGQTLGSAVPPMGRMELSSDELENIFGVEPWKGPAILRVQGEGDFDLLSSLVNPSGLTSNTNCVREDRVLNIEGFDSDNRSYIRLINTGGSDTGEIIGTVYDEDGNVVGKADSVLTVNLTSYQQMWLNRSDIASLVGSQWNGVALLEVNQINGLKLLNLNYITDEQTYFNFSCFEDSTSGRIYLQTTSTSQNISSTHIVNTSDEDQQFFGTLYSSDGRVVGFRNQPLHFDDIPPKGRLILSSEDIEEAFVISPWAGPAMLEVSGTGTFELMTKLTSPSGLTSNTNCVRKNDVQYINGFDKSDMTYIRFINIGDTPIHNIRGSIYGSDGNVVGEANLILVAELPAKAQIWRNRNELSSTFGDTWNGTASLKITNPDSNLRLLNLVYVNNRTYFNFSCYETGS